MFDLKLFICGFSSEGEKIWTLLVKPLYKREFVIHIGGSFKFLICVWRYYSKMSNFVTQPDSSSQVKRVNTGNKLSCHHVTWSLDLLCWEELTEKQTLQKAQSQSIAFVQVWVFFYSEKRQVDRNTETDCFLFKVQKYVLYSVSSTDNLCDTPLAVHKICMIQ